MRIGLVGCGYWGAKHLRVLHELGYGPGLVVSDSDEARLREVARTYPSVIAAADYAQLLEMTDAVIVATPPASHYTLAREALLAGRHVLVEKPFTVHSWEARELVDLARERQCILMVGHTFLYSAQVRALRLLLQEGRIGRVLHLDSQRLGFGFLQSDIHVFWDLAPHDISIFLYLTGQQPEKVAARAVHHLNDRNLWEVGHAHLWFPEGVSAHIHVSWLYPYKVRQVTVVGSTGTAIYDDMSAEPLRVCEREICFLSQNGKEEWRPPTYRWGDVYLPHVPQREPLLEEDAEFLHCVLTGAPPLSDGELGLSVVRILEALDTSLALDSQAVPLVPSPESLTPSTGEHGRT